MINEVLEIVKYKLGISTNVRDTFLIKLIESQNEELKTVYGIFLDENKANDVDFLADWIVEKYSKREEMSRMLKSRFYNYLFAKKKEV